jgi:hypothetical protein
MGEFVSYEDLQAQIRAALDELDEESERTAGVTVRGVTFGRSPRTPAPAALRAVLLALSESMGECREALPYAPMHPVRTSDGRFRWCCTHHPEHCGEDASG